MPRTIQVHINRWFEVSLTDEDLRVIRCALDTESERLHNDPAFKEGCKTIEEVDRLLDWAIDLLGS